MSRTSRASSPGSLASSPAAATTSRRSASARPRTVPSPAPGVLARIVGLISGRGYNIQTLSVGPTEDGTVSRMKIDVVGDDKVIRQIILQLNNQVNVIEVTSRRRA